MLPAQMVGEFQQIAHGCCNVKLIHLTQDLLPQPLPQVLVIGDQIQTVQFAPVGSDKRDDILHGLTGPAHIVCGAAAGTEALRRAHIVRLGIAAAVYEHLVGQRQSGGAGEHLFHGDRRKRAAVETMTGGQMIDGGAVGGDGVFDALDGQYIFRQGCIGAPAGDHDVDALGDGMLQSGPVCRREPAVPVQGGLVQIQRNTPNFHNIASSLSF